MARYKKQYFLANLTSRILVGSACCAHIARCYKNEWCFTVLEDLLTTAGYVGKYSKMLDGIVSEDESYDQIGKEIDNRTNQIIGTTAINYWKYNPLWEALFNRSTMSRYGGWFMENLCDIPEPYPYLPNKQFYLSNKIKAQELEYLDINIFSIDEFLTFENFFFNTALAHKALNNNQWHLIYRYGLITRELFPIVVSVTPELFVRWPLLAQVYRDTFWSPPPGYKGMGWEITDCKTLKQEMDMHEREARKIGIQLLPAHIFHKLNSKYLKKLILH